MSQVPTLDQRIHSVASLPMAKEQKHAIYMALKAHIKKMIAKESLPAMWQRLVETDAKIHKICAKNMLMHRELIYAMIKEVNKLYAKYAGSFRHDKMSRGMRKFKRRRVHTTTQMMWALEKGLVLEYEFDIFIKFWQKPQ